MTISQELISQLSEQTQEKQNPNNRVKYLHLRKEVILEDTVNQSNRRITLDGKTFNGKDHITATFGSPDEDVFTLNFDAATVAYKQNENGDLDVVLVFKSRKDEYTKVIGRRLADVVLNRYLNESDKVNMWHHTNHCGYHAMVITIPTTSFVGDAGNVLPPNTLGKLTVSDLRNSVVTKTIKSAVYDMIEYFATTTYVNCISFIPNYHIQ